MTIPDSLLIVAIGAVLMLVCWWMERLLSPGAWRRKKGDDYRDQGRKTAERGEEDRAPGAENKA